MKRKECLDNFWNWLPHLVPLVLHNRGRCFDVHIQCLLRKPVPTPCGFCLSLLLGRQTSMPSAPQMIALPRLHRLEPKVTSKRQSFRLMGFVHSLHNGTSNFGDLFFGRVLKTFPTATTSLSTAFF